MPTGTVCITIFSRGAEVHPVALVTVKEYVPGDNPEIDVWVPAPVEFPPGVMVSVHVPEDGRPVNWTLPVCTEQVGWVIASTTGAEGVTGCELIIIVEDDGDVPPEALVTVYV
jgi:hypothetical protein